MDSRKKAQSGDRRRRVLREGTTKKKRTATTKRAAKAMQLYETEAISSLQPRLTELLPHRKRSLTACLGFGAFVVIAMQALFLVRRNHLSELPAATTTPLHLMGAGTLSAWCGSLILAFAALVSLVIFSIRRHKVDDYHGRFGMWLTVALACLLASADAATGLHTTFNAIMARMTDHNPFGWTGSWWAMIGGVLGIYLFVRIVVDAWRSRGSVVSLSVTVVIYAAATLFFYRKWRLGSDQKDTMAHSSLLLFGHVMLAFSLLTYARYVFREAAGLIGKKTRKRKSSRSTAEKSRFASWFGRSSDKTKKRKTKPTKSKKPTKSTKKAPAEVEIGADHEEDDYDIDEFDQITQPEESARPLDKRARKRLKKQARRAA